MDEQPSKHLAKHPNTYINSYTLEQYFLSREFLLMMSLDDILCEDIAGEIIGWIALALSQAYLFGDNFLVVAIESSRIPSLEYPWIAECYLYNVDYFVDSEWAMRPKWIRNTRAKFPKEYIDIDLFGCIYASCKYSRALPANWREYDKSISLDEFRHIFTILWPEESVRQRKYAKYVRSDISEWLYYWTKVPPASHEIIYYRWDKIHQEISEYCSSR